MLADQGTQAKRAGSCDAKCVMNTCRKTYVELSAPFEVILSKCVRMSRNAFDNTKYAPVNLLMSTTCPKTSCNQSTTAVAARAAETDSEHLAIGNEKCSQPLLSSALSVALSHLCMQSVCPRVGWSSTIMTNMLNATKTSFRSVTSPPFCRANG
eukprot:6203260-Pleurochrysis_carterae.AAC.3